MLEKFERKRNQRNERGVTGSLNNKKEDTLSHMDKGKSTNTISAVCQLLIFPRQIQCSLGVG